MAISETPGNNSYKNNHKGKGKNYDINIVSRRQQVIMLIGEGLTLNEISIRLDVGYDTIIDDKKAIIKAGVKFLKSLGNKELSFYYQGIIADMNHIKQDLWGILKKDYSQEKQQCNIYYPKDKLNAYRNLINCNTELREIFKECISLFVIEDYDNRIKRLEQLSGINETNNKSNYMNLGLPKLESELNKSKSI